MNFAHDPVDGEVEKELAKVEAMQQIALQLERIADSMEGEDE